MKATFTITLVHTHDYIGLSNMPVEKNKTRKDGLVETRFQKSVRMSSYLVTFIVCDFEHTFGTTGTNDTIKVSHKLIETIWTT